MNAPERFRPTPGDPDQDGMGLDGLLLILRRHAVIVIAMIALIMGGALLYLQTADERYRAHATIILSLSEIRVDRTAVQLETFDVTRALVETELDVLQSRAFAAEVAERLSLAEHPLFQPAPDAPPSSPEERQTTIVDELLNSYSVFRSGESLAIEIVAETGDPELAAAIANMVAETYIDLSARNQRGEIEQSISFLERRVDDLSAELGQLEFELTDFIRENDLDDEGRLSELLAEQGRLTATLPLFEGDEFRAEEAERVRRELGGIQARLREHTRATLTLERMERSMAAQQTRYENALARLNELETQLDFVPRLARQVTVAQAPLEPVWPNRPVTLALSFVAAVVLAFVAALLMESLNRRIWSEVDVQRATGLLNFGALPRIRRRGLLRRPADALDSVRTAPRSVFNEGLRGILTLWMNIRRGNSAKVLMITSSLPGEGKSTVALSLAKCAALDGMHVLLIDLDLHRRGATSLAKAHLGQRPADSAAQHEKNSADVDILTGQEIEEMFKSLDSRGRLNRQVLRMAREELFPTLRAEYDLIVLDTPPVLVVDDACRIGPLADGVLIVVRWGRSASEELREAADRLRRSGAEVTGTIFNDVNPGVQSRYYGAGGYTGGKMASRYHDADA